RIYFLELMSHYYERFHEDVLELNKKLAENFKNSIVSYGNDPLDALQGIEQFVYNLPQMITHPSYKELLSKRKNISDTAIIVSTGPSLTKQLPLLKKYASKATIFCADSSYPILAKHGIKPDYVCMLERSEFTAEFFNNDFGEFDKDVCFIIKSVVHPNAIHYLNKKTDNFTIVSTYASFIEYLKLDYFGYFNMGFSVAHMACYLSLHLNHKNIIFIGQDLAYAKNGNSHPNEHIFGALDGEKKETISYDLQTTAYGGEGLVYTQEVWNLFRNIFEQDVEKIQKYLDTKVYNCTEGGARIEGTIEKPFLWACENLLDKDLNKPFVKLEPLSLNKQNEFLLKAYYKVCKSIEHCKDFSNKFIKSYDKIKNSFTILQNSQENETLIKEIIKDIDKIKTQIDELYNTQKDLMQILGPLL
ncbi:motility associated factor glycosyltransferase family protein, partial [Campylobacter jejuni]